MRFVEAFEDLAEDRYGAVIDVRSPGEFDEDHLPGAINLPLRQIEAHAIELLDRRRPVVVYCWDSA